MAQYYVNKRPQDDGYHEVHKTGCSFMPEYKLDLGEHTNCQSAVLKAKEEYPKSDGCYFCCKECHTR